MTRLEWCIFPFACAFFDQALLCPMDLAAGYKNISFKDVCRIT